MEALRRLYQLEMLFRGLEDGCVFLEEPEPEHAPEGHYLCGVEPEIRSCPHLMTAGGNHGPPIPAETQTPDSTFGAVA
jgi:hypothetical protein